MQHPAPAQTERKARPIDMPKLAPGTRVQYEYGRWESQLHGTEVIYDAQLATRSWAGPPRFGTVVADQEFGPFPANNPWGVPSIGSAVRFDNEPKVTWVRTACLDLIGFAQKEESQFELFVFQEAS